MVIYAWKQDNTENRHVLEFIKTFCDNMKDNVKINIYGGNNQVIPNVKEVEQHIYTEEGETIVINKFKVK